MSCFFREFHPKTVYQIYANEHFTKTIYLICKTVSNLCECIFHDYDILPNIAENGYKWKKPDVYNLSQKFTTENLCPLINIDAHVSRN